MSGIRLKSSSAFADQSSLRAQRIDSWIAASLEAKENAPSTAAGKEFASLATHSVGIERGGEEKIDVDATARPAAAYSNSFIGLRPAFDASADSGNSPTAH